MSAPYFYRYADPTECGPRAPLQLEFWIPKGRKGGSWVAHHAVPVGNYRTWRKVRKFHSHADKLTHSVKPRAAGYARSREKQCEAYCEWARLKGLQSVTAFYEDWYSLTAARKFGYEPRTVLVEDFIGDAPAPEHDA